MFDTLPTLRCIAWSSKATRAFLSTAAVVGGTVLLAGCLQSGGLAQPARSRGLNVIELGADPTGTQDCTQLLQEIHARKQHVLYPNGTYRFNGATLDFTGGVEFESRDGVIIRNDISAAPVVQFDDQGHLIGLQQNHLEQDDTVLGAKGRVPAGSLVSPPLSTASPRTAVDFIAHWYNDGGLECRRLGGGWVGWYYWCWNFHAPKMPGGKTGDGYDPARHPLLGFYRGDDPVVLDWQCYWLAEYGVKAVTLCSGSSIFDGWDRPESEKYWLYQLFHNAPNFPRLQYIMWPPTPYLKSTPENRKKVETGWEDLVDRIYLRFPNFYAIKSGGKLFPVLFIFEGEAVRGVFDNYHGAEQTAAFYIRIAQRFRAAGFGGVALFARHATPDKLMSYAELERQGVLYFNASYAEDHSSGKTYPEHVANYAPPSDPRAIVNTATALHTHSPHPSKWVCPGHTPDLFRQELEKAVAHVQTHNMLRIVTCYNVAEWAEGGPGLQPNMQDRFGYLDAVKAAVGLPPDAEPRENNVFRP